VPTDREILESIYERWNRHDGDLALDLFADDAEIRQSAELLDTARVFIGPAGLEESARELVEAFRQIDWHHGAWVDEGDWSICGIRFIGIGHASGIETEATAAHAWRLQDGLVTHFYVYPSVSAAVRALAASAEPGASASE
jgi:ketosteroid isomerase-like protein